MESAALAVSPSKQQRAHSSRPSSQPKSSFKGHRGFAAPTPLGEWANRVPASKNGTKANSAPASRKSSNRPSTSAAHNNARNRPASIAELDTTPPARPPFPHDVTGLDENRVQDLLLGGDQHAKPQPPADKRKSRPSLSDRTLETLSLISPTPSPGRIKSNFLHVDSPMGPPSRPASKTRRTKTRNAVGIPDRARDVSPTRKPLKPATPSLPVKTPPIAHFSRLPLASPMGSPSRPVRKGEPSVLTKPTPTIKRAPTSRATITARSTFERQALSTLFRRASDYSSATSAGSTSPTRDVERTPRPIHRTSIVPRTPSLESIPFSTGSTSRSTSTSSQPSASEFENAEETQTQSSRASSTSSDRLSSALPSPAREYFDKEPEPDLESISLDLSSTNLTSFPIYSLTDPTIFTHVTSLNLSHNALDATKYLDNTLFLPHLTSLSLVSTGLASILPLRMHLSAPALKVLNISCHRLSGPVPKFRYYFPMLEEVIATDGWFDVVETRTLVGLKRLDLRNNCIGEADVEERRGDWKVLGVEVLL
jgi:hypothetical protein